MEILFERKFVSGENLIRGFGGEDLQFQSPNFKSMVKIAPKSVNDRMIPTISVESGGGCLGKKNKILQKLYRHLIFKY